MDVSGLKTKIVALRGEIETTIVTAIKAKEMGGVSKLADADKLLGKAIDRLDDAVEKSKPREKKAKEEKKDDKAAAKK